jgi:hypothetical protein
MSSPYLTPELALNCNSDVSDIPYLAIPWNTVNSNVPDWIEKVYVGRILGSVRIDGNPAQREIVVVSAQTEVAAVLATATSSLSTGAYDISWNTYTGPVLAMLLDDLGIEWAPDTIYQQGTVIYPRAWNGWQYECVSGGTGPTDEPTWWAGEGVTAIIGTATFKARQYISAQAHGPRQPIVEEH